jgi:hypothetical protein
MEVGCMKAKGIISLLLAVGIALSLWSLNNKMSAGAVEVKASNKAETVQIPMQKPVADGGLVAAAENERLILYFDNQSGGIAVEERATGSKFYSNPPKALEDPKASDVVKQELLSQVRLVYNRKGKEGDLEMNSYKDALKLEQLSWGKLERGLRVEMVLGREEQRLLLPRQITKSSFEKNILDRMNSERGKKQLQAYYILYTRDDLAGDKGQELLSKYPVLNEEDIYVLKSSITERDKSLLEEYAKSAGYTFEMMEDDHKKVRYSGDDAVFPYFKLKIDYVLEDKGLSATLQAGDIQYDKERFNLVGLSLLNFFGAGATGEDGYLFLPDGSGTLIRFNNDGRKNTLLTTGKLYGQDNALSLNPRGSFKQEFRAPVFGIKRDGTALLSVIEEGDAVAEINGVMGNINHSWNTAYANFTIRNKDTFIAENAFEQAPWNIYEKNQFEGSIAMRYYFLTGDDADYVGMAKAYREYLVDKGTLHKITPGPQVPFYLDTMGSVETMVRKWGIPVSSQVPITSFEQAGRMLDELSGRGVGNIKLRYTGWYNGGYFHTAPARVKVEGVLGGSKGLRNLSKIASGLGAQVFPDADFVYVSSNRSFDGFSPKKDSIRSLFQKIGNNGSLNPAVLEYENMQWIINPGKIPGYYSKFSKAYDSLGLNTISLSTLGEGLHSNFKNNSRVNRQQSRTIAVDVLAKAKNDYGDVLSDYGNAYIFPYVDHILNLPETDSSYSIADRQVPFLQVALHGYIQYAGEALNLANELRPAVLKALEYGSGVYFKLNYGEGSMLKDAFLFDEVYASEYADWKEEAAVIFSEMNEALRDVQDQAIVNHQQLEAGVFKTTYENGKAIIVNYNDKNVQVEGIAVEPIDFAIVRP